MIKRFNILIDEKLKTELKEKAESKGLKLSAYIRMVLVESLKEEK